MKFEKKLNLRLFIAIGWIIIGIAFGAVQFTALTNDDRLLAFGIVFVIVGIRRTFEIITLKNNKDKLRKREIAETDERNIMIYEKARSFAFTFYSSAAAITVIILFIMKQEFAGEIVAYNLCGLCIAYLICYYIIRRKH